MAGLTKARYPDGKEFTVPEGTTIIGGASGTTVETKTEGGLKMPEICPECGVVHTHKQVEKLEGELTTRQGVIDQLNQSLKSLTGEKDNLTSRVSELEKAKETGKPVLPTLKELIAHCTSGECPEHAQEYKELKESLAKETMTSLTPDYVRGLMKLHKIEGTPEKIIIGPNLAQKLRR